MTSLEHIEPNLIPSIPISGNVAIDVGANKGSWTNFLSKRFRKVYSIEPNPQALSQLKSELPDNAQVLEVAAWSKNEYREFLIYPPSELMHESSLDASYIRSDSVIGAIKLNCVTIDSLDIHHPVDFIKMDIEGSEVEAIKGSIKLLKTDHPKIVIEMHHLCEVDTMIEFLYDLCYDIDQVDKWLICTYKINVPVTFIIFNRPEFTKQAFQKIREYKPRELLVIADGPRGGDDPRKCKLCREIATSIDWPNCQLQCNFSNTNLGCAERIISGLNWVFDNVDKSIILEDDIIANSSFFRYCSELLNRFENDKRIGTIAGCTPRYMLDRISASGRDEYSYLFSQCPRIWGWGTWSDRWKQYDRYISKWPEFKKFIHEVFLDPVMNAQEASHFDQVYKSSPEWQFTWDYQWTFLHYFNSWLSVNPTKNLIDNIGFGPLADATHTTFERGDWYPGVSELEFPLRHPPGVLASRSYDLFGNDRWNQLFPDHKL